MELGRLRYFLAVAEELSFVGRRGEAGWAGDAAPAPLSSPEPRVSVIVSVLFVAQFRYFGLQDSH